MAGYRRGVEGRGGLYWRTVVRLRQHGYVRRGAYHATVVRATSFAGTGRPREVEDPAHPSREAVQRPPRVAHRERGHDAVQATLGLFDRRFAWFTARDGVGDRGKVRKEGSGR